MAKLSSGKELKPDFNRITVLEYRTLLSTTDVNQEDELIGKVYGLTGDELRALGFLDYKTVTKEFITAARDPVGFDPN